MACRVVSTFVCSGFYPGKNACISKEGDVYKLDSNSFDVHLEKVPSLSNIISVCVGSSHMICLDINGNVFTKGKNAYGQLGQGKNGVNIAATKDILKVDIPVCKEISCGSDFNVCLTDDGYVYAFGKHNGDIGIPPNAENVDYSHFPQQIDILKDIEFIECGTDHTFFKSINNDIYCWGKGFYGQLGIEEQIFVKIPIKNDKWPNNIVDIKCGSMHTLVLTSDGEVYSSGWRSTFVSLTSSYPKKLPLSNIKRIASGDEHGLCINEDNDIYVFGNNEYSQLGLGEDLFEQELKKTGKSNIDYPLKHPLLSNIADISSGGLLTFVKTYDNEIYGFGNEADDFFITFIEWSTPTQVLQGYEDNWKFSNFKYKAKSARK